MHDRPRSRVERGSALILVPAFLIILVMAAGFAIDWSIAFLGEREAAHAAAAAANDAAGAALNQASFQAGSGIQIDANRASEIAAESVRARASTVLHDLQVLTTVNGNRVTVTVHATVATVFSGALPFVGKSIDVEAKATASPHEGPPKVAP